MREAGRSGMEDDDGGLDRGDGEEEKEDDWNNYKTGGPIQLEGDDGKIVENKGGKVIRHRK
jgi:hypothetical protein